MSAREQVGGVGKLEKKGGYKKHPKSNHPIARDRWNFVHPKKVMDIKFILVLNTRIFHWLPENITRHKTRIPYKLQQHI